MTDTESAPLWVIGWDVSTDREHVFTFTKAHVIDTCPHNIWVLAHLGVGEHPKMPLWDLLADTRNTLCVPCLFASPRDSEGLARCD